MKTLDPDEQLGYLVVRAADGVSRSWHAALRAHAINPRQFSALALLVREPDLSQAELARRLMITPQSMSESIVALVDTGLLRRAAPSPGLASKLEVTRRGSALLRKAYPVVERVDRDSFAILTRDEQHHLRRLLRKLLLDPAPARSHGA